MKQAETEAIIQLVADLTPVTRFPTPFTYKRQTGEINTEPSETQPDMALTVKEILVRYAQGRPLHTNTKLVYTGDQQLPDVDRMDQLEHMDYIRENIRVINELEQKFKNEKEAEKQAAIKNNEPPATT